MGSIFIKGMTAESTTSLNNFLNDMIAPLQEGFPRRNVMMDELRRNTKRHNFNGLQVRVPLLLVTKQGTGGFAETAGPNAARQLDDRAAFIKMARVGHAIELSVDLLRAGTGENFVAAGDALKLHMDQAEAAMARMENEMILGTGDGLIAAVTAVGTTTTTVTVGTAANFYQLYPGRVVDILARSNGAVTSLGRVIQSTNPAAGTLVVDAAISTAATDGIYMEGTYGNAIQGVMQTFATSGTFEGIDRAAVVQWQGIEGRGTAAPGAGDLSIAIMDGAYRRVMQASGKVPDFWIGDPAAIDKYSQSLLAQFRWDVKYTRLATGWEGVDYRGTPIIPEFNTPTGTVIGINKNALTFYGFGNGPEWDDLTGNKFQRFTRNAPVEAWLLDFVQLGVHQPNALVRIPQLNQAA
jgi:hypothetical protein